MRNIELDREDEHVKQFVKSLTVDPDGVLLRLNGQPLLKVTPPYGMSPAEKKALIDERRELMRQVREHVKGKSPKAIEREVQQAVDEVRRRKQQ